MSGIAGKPTLIIDADDTLWENNIFYEQCIADFAALMEAQGFDAEEAEHMLELVERERVPVVGYSPAEFARSLQIAYQRLCARYSSPICDRVNAMLWEIGLRVGKYPIILLDGVEETLRQLSQRFRLLLLTKGDHQTQSDKLRRSGLAHFFEAVHIVKEKHPGVFRELVDCYGLNPACTWMVGDSPRSDILPALEAGIGAIHIPHPNTWKLELEVATEPAGAIVLSCFSELVSLFQLTATGE